MFQWRDFSRVFREGDHAFLSPSQYSWINYDDEKLVTTYMARLAAARGTATHDLACKLINLKVGLPDLDKTLNLYVNDCLHYKMKPEVKLYYSPFCFGTADALSFDSNVLRVFDLKTGKVKASFMQLLIYAALFFLCYPEVRMGDLKVGILRIYQNDKVVEKETGVDEILPIMDKIKRYSKILEGLEEEYNDRVSGSSWSRP